MVVRRQAQGRWREDWGVRKGHGHDQTRNLDQTATPMLGNALPKAHSAGIQGGMGEPRLGTGLGCTPDLHRGVGTSSQAHWSPPGTRQGCHGLPDWRSETLIDWLGMSIVAMILREPGKRAQKQQNHKKYM